MQDIRLKAAGPSREIINTDNDRRLFLFRIESADFQTKEFKVFHVLAESESDARQMGGACYQMAVGKVELVKDLRLFGWGTSNFNKV